MTKPDTLDRAAPALRLSLIRTAVPALVGWLLTLPFMPALLDLLAVDSETARDRLTGGLTIAVGLLYYLLGRVLELYVKPRWGVLLGKAAAVLYAQEKPDGSYEITDLPRPVDAAPSLTVPLGSGAGGRQLDLSTSAKHDIIERKTE